MKHDIAPENGTKKGALRHGRGHFAAKAGQRLISSETPANLTS